MTTRLQTIFTPILALTLLLWPSHGIGSSLERLLDGPVRMGLTFVNNDFNFTSFKGDLKEAVGCKKETTVSAFGDLNEVVSGDDYIKGIPSSIRNMADLIENKEELLTTWTPESSECWGNTWHFDQGSGGDTENVGFDRILTAFFSSN